MATKSRVIDGSYGKYRICNLRDSSSESLSLSLYEPHVEKIEEHQVYLFTKLKKGVLKSDGSIRLSTTKFSQIVGGSQAENELFANVQVADSLIEGPCIMFTNYSSYDSCPTHTKKVDVDGECQICGTKIDPNNVVKDFHCVLHIENNDDIMPILVFKRLLNKLPFNMEEAEESLEQLVVGKTVKIHYNTKEDQDKTNVAVKIDVEA